MLTEQVKGYINFIRTQGVAGFAIGFILGKAVSDLIGSFVNDIVNPVIGLVFTKFGNLSELAFHTGNSTIAYGKFLTLLINFFILAAIVYFGITKLSGRLDKPKDTSPTPPKL